MKLYLTIKGGSLIELLRLFIFKTEKTEGKNTKKKLSVCSIRTFPPLEVPWTVSS